MALYLRPMHVFWNNGPWSLPQSIQLLSLVLNVKSHNPREALPGQMGSLLNSFVSNITIVFNQKKLHENEINGCSRFLAKFPLASRRIFCGSAVHFASRRLKLNGSGNTKFILKTVGIFFFFFFVLGRFLQPFFFLAIQ
jgi:hypothetical protein